MKLQKGDYIKLEGLTLYEVESVRDSFFKAGIAIRAIVDCESIKANKILYVNKSGVLEFCQNAFLLTRELTYDQITGVADNVNHPPHYTQHPSGVECIEITRHMGSNLGNAIKYIWRADLKNDAIEDLKKAVFYINDEIERRSNEK